MKHLPRTKMLRACQQANRRSRMIPKRLLRRRPSQRTVIALLLVCLTIAHSAFIPTEQAAIRAKPAKPKRTISTPQTVGQAGKGSAPQAAALLSVEPALATQGQPLTVTLRGSNTHWVNGQTQASFGGEVFVENQTGNDAPLITVLDATTATAKIRVSASAALAPRTVIVTTPQSKINPEEIVALNDGFTVAAATLPGSPTATVTTIAGLAGTAGFADGTGAQARFHDLAGLAVGPDDAVYIADAGNHRIRVARNQPGTQQWMITTLAGDGIPGFQNGAGATARFNNPQAVAVDSSGIVYVADTDNHSIRRIAIDGTVSTVAGDGTPGLQNGQGNAARFRNPRAVAVDNQGTLYVADTGNHAIRRIDTSGVVSTLAGDGTAGADDFPNARFNGPAGIAFDRDSSTLYVADTGNHRIREIDLTGIVGTTMGGERGFLDGPDPRGHKGLFADPAGIAVDANSRLIIADSTNSLVRDLIAGPAPIKPVVSTIAGTGARDSSDGAGNVARLFTPRGVAITLASAIIVADTGNHTLRRITRQPRIVSFAPPQAHTGDTVMITGENFDARATTNNTVRFTRSGGGQTIAQVINATRSQLTVVVPADAATGPVSVETEGGTGTSPINFVVIGSTATPVITDFNPRSGQVGTVVALQGRTLAPGPGLPTVTFAGSGGTRLPALVNQATDSTVLVTVPNGAVTGFIELTNALGRATTDSPFTVEHGQQNFQISAAPSSATAVEFTSATYIIHLTSSQPTFSQLASLAASGLPAGVDAAFDPQQITAGASSTLRLSLNGQLSPGSYSFTINATALVDGSPVTRSTSAMLTVVAAGQTTLSGRVLSTEGEPIMGATVSLDGRTATTDAAGAFLLVGATAGPDRPVMVDGRTASAPNRTYPIIVEPATLLAGQANVVPFTFYLPAIDTQYEVEVVPGRDTIVTSPRLPGLKVVIPAGANLRNRDGSPVTRASITPVPIDRTPAPIPTNVFPAQVFTNQPGGALADEAMPVIYPNLTGASPGAQMNLYAFNHDNVQWEIYGTGRVSADGRTIVPEINPQTNKPYGLRDFSWHFPSSPPPPDMVNDNPNACDACAKTCSDFTEVDMSTGIEMDDMTSQPYLGGARGGVQMGRVYTGDLAVSGVTGSFGLGMKNSYDIRLVGTFLSGGSGRMVRPEDLMGRLFNYVRTEANGTLVFDSTATITLVGDFILKLTNGTYEYHSSEGDVMKFDATGRLTAMLDRNGNTTTMMYDASGNLIRVTDAAGRATVLGYDGQGRIISETDSINRVTQYIYDGSGRLSVVIDALGQGMSYFYDGFNRLIGTRDKRGNIMKRITYDANGRVSLIFYGPDQRFETYTYTLSGRVVTGVTVADSLGRTWMKRFNAAGYVIEEIDALGQRTRIERDITTNLPLTTTGPCGCAESTRQYDARGNVTSMTDRLGQTITMEYEPVFNKITKLTDKLGRVTRYAYDARGNLTSLTDALNQTTMYSYDSFGEVTSVTDALNHITRREYDARGNISASIDPLGNRTTYEHDQVGRLLAVNDPLSRRVTMTYDALDRMLTMTDAAGATTTYEYDQNGNQLRKTDHLGRQWTSTYDASNRLTKLTDPLQRITTMEYDREDELMSLTTPEGRAVNYTYDARGQTIKAEDTEGDTIEATYDTRGNLMTMRDQRGNLTSYTYDELYRQTATRDALGRLAVRSYDAMSNITSVVDRLGRRLTIGYDQIYRPVSLTYTDATVTRTYDAASRLIRIDDTQAGSIQWNFDDANRVVKETTLGGIVSYGYNTASQRMSMTAADRPAVNYAYDSAGRLQTITQGAESFSYAYDILSRRTGMQRPNGVTTGYEYDEVHRLTRLMHVDQQAQTLEDLQYSYTTDDQIGAITSLAATPVLPTAKTASVADATNRIGNVGGASYSFDQEGQLTAKTVAGDTTTYQWDARGRLRRVTFASGQKVDYIYDALGRLTKRIAGTASTSYLYDGSDVVLDRNSDGSTVDYLNGAGIDDKLRQSSAAGPLYFLHDHVGSTLALTNADGSVVELQQYEAFGDAVPSARTRFGYTGRERDAATGLMYYRARWYDAQLGRFISEDPIGIAGGNNYYAYVGNNPVSFIDPFGQCKEDKDCQAKNFDDLSKAKQDELRKLGISPEEWNKLSNNEKLGYFNITGAIKDAGLSLDGLKVDKSKDKGIQQDRVYFTDADSIYAQQLGTRHFEADINGGKSHKEYTDSYRQDVTTDSLQLSFTPDSMNRKLDADVDLFNPNKATGTAAHVGEVTAHKLGGLFGIGNGKTNPKRVAFKDNWECK